MPLSAAQKTLPQGAHEMLLATEEKSLPGVEDAEGAVA